MTVELRDPVPERFVVRSTVADGFRLAAGAFLFLLLVAAVAGIVYLAWRVVAVPTSFLSPR